MDKWFQHETALITSELRSIFPRCFCQKLCSSFSRIVRLNLLKYGSFSLLVNLTSSTPLKMRNLSFTALPASRNKSKLVFFQGQKLHIGVQNKGKGAGRL